MSEMNKIAEKIKSADAILIGASNGLSITEGIHLFANNQAFGELFGDYQRKYGLTNLLSGMLGQWPSDEEMWGFWSRMVNHYSNNYEPSNAMKDLRAIVGDRDYFVVTSNGEQHFEKAGFDDDKVFEVEGDWLHMQCASGCHNERYEWSDLAKKMAESQVDGRVPTDLIPKCPRCGDPMIPNMAASHSFIPKPGVQEAYKDFLSKMCIALKETAETIYWLRLLHETEYITDIQFTSMNRDACELKAILSSIIKTKRSRMESGEDE